MAGIYITVGQSIKSDNGIYYRVLQFLGNGANAFAYRTLCTSGQNRGIEFVIKIQYNLSSEIRRERFLREIAFLNSCSHPAILAQFDYGTFTTAQEKYPFIVTNYMPETLASKIHTEIPFDLKVKYSCQLLSAVAFLQSQGIIHRDIKPSNIFISNDNAILGDFGLIKKIETEDRATVDDDIDLVNSTVLSSLSGYVAMARYYRTPELVNYANKISPLYLESDIFQLGLVLAELFTGKNPLHPVDDLHAPIQMDDIGYISAPHHGGVIHDTITQMLQIDRLSRIKLDLAIDRFSGIYS